MTLDAILKNIPILKNAEDIDIEISDICYDSRNIKPNCIFVCLKGAKFDGHDYINEAFSKGTSVVVVQEDVDFKNIPIIKVENTRKFLALASANFFGNPDKKLKTIAITGTKGKTTTSFMVRSILEKASLKTGIIGTIGVVMDENITKLNNTTPESYEIHKNFKKMVDNGANCVVMEVSSIGVKSYRSYGIDFDYAVFTNFSSDHIGENEHKDLDEYFKFKNMLFNNCKNAVVNLDDEKSEKIISEHLCDKKTFSLKSNSDLKAENINLINNGGEIGVTFDFSGFINSNNIKIKIPGVFNVYNAMAASLVCKLIGVSDENIKLGLSETKVKGRVEPINISYDYALFIDYAHNAVSMENILTTFKEYNPKRLITMFGAGGNRPKIRRYEMGETSGKFSDLSVITSDNPRNENPLDIIEDIKLGINKTNGKYIVIPDRKEAIEYCIKNAEKGDIIVLAGKGHEDYQEINGVKYPFDERMVINDIVNRK
ncbi:MAG: UDP-N-acetylmuramoyl-L-alanyl-D-glutamate--2,6-diaminopimelate ligase [Clostridia bacterium]|nr:UDP-N-acetylmuramoyl-L-alanyl-D-glutamate--2,6-diaminopimelate ligase [Clostridia bacterium]